MTRKLGLLLVIVGFGWLALLQGKQSLRGGIRPILAVAYAKVDHGGRSAIPSQEVIELLSETADRCYDAQPLFLLPGVTMLIGALLIGRRSVSTSGDKKTHV
jgi:hypothetical protein